VDEIEHLPDRFIHVVEFDDVGQLLVSVLRHLGEVPAGVEEVDVLAVVAVVEVGATNASMTASRLALAVILAGIALTSRCVVRVGILRLGSAPSTIERGRQLRRPYSAGAIGGTVLRSWETAVMSCAGANGFANMMLFGTPLEAQSSASLPLM
jgi:hypothetical protein